jgi:RNA polymerase sigma-70 factor (ECF subfamily)
MAQLTSSFPSSRWSLVARVGGTDPAQARRALTDLCTRYWYPIYVYIRRQVRTEQEAEDLTQGFFTHVLEREVIAAADPARGRFRSYLLTCCRNYLSNRRRAAKAQREGGNIVLLSLDFESAATRYAREPADPVDAESLYLRRWAFSLLDATFAALAAEYQEQGQGALYARLVPGLSGVADAARYADIGRELGVSENSVKKAAQRLRERFRDELRARIADTVDDPAHIADEIRDLFAAVR